MKKYRIIRLGRRVKKALKETRAYNVELRDLVWDMLKKNGYGVQRSYRASFGAGWIFVIDGKEYVLLCPYPCQDIRKAKLVLVDLYNNAIRLRRIPYDLEGYGVINLKDLKM